MADRAVIAPSDELAPPTARGPAAWMSKNLFGSWTSTLITIIALLILGRLAIWFVDWAFVRAIWSVPGVSIADTQVCRADHAGACWALVREKYRFILFGLYPFAEQWRPASCVAVFIALYALTADRRMWSWRLVPIWLIGLTSILILMRGGLFGLTTISEDLWGGLPVTLWLATFGLALAFPLAVVVALGRMSQTNRTVRLICVLYVELIRGVPLISVLFMASVMFPLFLPEGLTISKLLRAQLAITLFAAAYLSEVIRGGLQAVGKGQSEAADALGLSYGPKMGLVILPQALRLVLPPIVSLCIAFFKSTSLVMIIGIFDLLNAARRAVAEPAWQGFGSEAYLFVALIYFCFCFAMSRYGQSLEARGQSARFER